MHQAMLACHDSLFRYARALSRDQAEAEELVQECYRRALGAVRKPSPGETEGRSKVDVRDPAKHLEERQEGSPS